MTELITRIGPLPVKRRRLTVKAVRDLTPNLRRVTLGGSDLAEFHSPGADDHVKLFFPAPGGEEAPMRDYTPRAFRPDAQELDLDFVLHGDGPGTTWAARAQPGDEITVGGPRGSTLVTYAFGAYLLVGDDAALPAIARRLEELPAGVPVTAIIEVEHAGCELPLPTAADLRLTWLHRAGAAPGTTSLLLDAVKALPAFSGQVYAWVGAERRAASALREHLVAERGLDKEHVRAAAYWTRDEG